MRQTELLILQEILIRSAFAFSSQVSTTAFEAGRLSTYITLSFYEKFHFNFTKL